MGQLLLQILLESCSSGFLIMARDPKRAASSRDAIEIRRAAELRIWHEQFWRDAAARNPALGNAIEFQADLEFLGGVAGRRWSDVPRRLRTRTFRIMLKRFGKLPTRQLLEATSGESDSPIRLILRPRADRELRDGGRRRREFERDHQDARLLVAFEEHRARGLAFHEAMEAAAEELGALSRGADGLKKALTRARRRARQRGFVEPLAPVIAAITGSAKDPTIQVTDLSARGRPKKRLRRS